MKKLESLSLNKFKAYELKKESHNLVLGGWRGVTHRSGGDTNDEYNDATQNQTTCLYPSADVTTVKTASAQ